MKKTNKSVKKNASSKDTKLPKIGNNKQKSKSPSKNQSNSKNKNLSNSKSKNNIKILKTSANANNMSEIAKKKEETNEKRKKRLEKEKKEEARDKKVYEQVLKEFQEKNKARAITEVNARKRLTSPKNKNDEIDNIKLPKIRISEKKTQFLLEENGMLDAYKYLIIQLCKNGLPTGNLFEYSAYVIRNYEKKWKEKKSKMNKEKAEQYWKGKKEEIAKFDQKKKTGDKNSNLKINKEEEIKMNNLKQSLKQREINKLLQSMDKSRSSRNYQEFPKFSKNKSEEKLPNIEDGLKVTINQKEGKSNKNKSPKKGNKNKSPASAKIKSASKNNIKSKSPKSSAAAKKKK